MEKKESEKRGREELVLDRYPPFLANALLTSRQVAIPCSTIFIRITVYLLISTMKIRTSANPSSAPSLHGHGGRAVPSVSPSTGKEYKGNSIQNDHATTKKGNSKEKRGPESRENIIGG